MPDIDLKYEGVLKNVQSLQVMILILKRFKRTGKYFWCMLETEVFVNTSLEFVKVLRRGKDEGQKS